MQSAAVEFFLLTETRLAAPSRDESIVGKVMEAVSDRVVVDIQIATSAVAGDRGFTVTTPREVVPSPADVVFTVGGEGPITPVRSVEEVDGIGSATAEKLGAAGITDLGKLAGAKVELVAEALGITEEHATEFIMGAKELLGVPKVQLSGRTVDEVSGIGTVSVARLAENGITDLAEVAAMEPVILAKILATTEMRAEEFILEAQRLLR